MKNNISILLCFLFLGVIFSVGCNSSDKEQKPMTYDDAPSSTEVTKTGGEIAWMSWAEAIEKNKTDKKKVFIDMYTDWCGWCKKMDASTFKDPTVAKYLNDNFHAVKFDAEQKEPITFRGQTYEFTKAGRRGAHGLAVALLNGRLGYPSFVYLDENMDGISVSPGFKKADGLMNELTWIGSNSYKKQTLDQFSE